MRSLGRGRKTDLTKRKIMTQQQKDKRVAAAKSAYYNKGDEMTEITWNLVGGENCKLPDDGRNVRWLSQMHPAFHSLLTTTVREFEAKAFGGLPDGEDGCGLRAWRYVSNSDLVDEPEGAE